VITQETSVHCV